MLTDKLLLIDLIDKLLSEILADTKDLEKGRSPFHCKDVPSISLGNYLKSTPRLTQESLNSPTAPTLSSSSPSSTSTVSNRPQRTSFSTTTVSIGEPIFTQIVNRNGDGGR